MKAVRILLFVSSCFSSTFILAQISFEARVLDSLTKKPVAFTAVGIKGTSRGCLSNEDGLFKMQGVLPTDTLIISNITYKKRQIPVSKVLSNPAIYITAFERSLQEMVVYANDATLYDLFELCRKQLGTSKKTQSKLYFVLESEIGEQPVELMECYYNAWYDNSGFEDLGFKNGRVALAPYSDRFFVNRNTSKAISFLSLTTAAERLPAIPFQQSKKQLKKNFHLQIKNTVSGPNPIYCIAFEPKLKDGNSFSGEAWIEKNTGVLQKIILQVDSTNTHP
ncbi:MAG: carboxypeptidase-like regulatory domain-containing protein, partial [Bacteroidia bacterium]|nr:carboxypeptidase-like regulatory domain-containing protein [Bacteroidia bacterium]